MQRSEYSRNLFSQHLPFLHILSLASRHGKAEYPQRFSLFRNQAEQFFFSFAFVFHTYHANQRICSNSANTTNWKVLFGYIRRFVHSDIRINLPQPSASCNLPRNHFRLDRHLCSGFAERFPGGLLIHAVNLKKYAPRLGGKAIPLRVSLALAHADFWRLCRVRHIGKDANPDLAAFTGAPRKDFARRFKLV